MIRSDAQLLEDMNRSESPGAVFQFHLDGQPDLNGNVRLVIKPTGQDAYLVRMPPASMRRWLLDLLPRLRDDANEITRAEHGQPAVDISPNWSDDLCATIDRAIAELEERLTVTRGRG